MAKSKPKRRPNPTNKNPKGAKAKKPTKESKEEEPELLDNNEIEGVVTDLAALRIEIATRRGRAQEAEQVDTARDKVKQAALKAILLSRARELEVLAQEL